MGPGNRTGSTTLTIQRIIEEMTEKIQKLYSDLGQLSVGLHHLQIQLSIQQLEATRANSLVESGKPG